MFEFFIVVVLFWGGRKLEFVKDWLGFVSFFVLYEFLRGVVDGLSPFGETTYYYVYFAEKYIFPTLPTKFLQDTMSKSTLVNSIALTAYLSFFYYSFLAGFIIWIKNKGLFTLYTRNFLFLSYIGLVMFFLIPTAPPWYVNSHLVNLGITRFIYDGALFNNLRGLSLYRYFVGGNLVAALPSLHVAWVAYTSLFIVRHYNNKIKLISLLLPLLVSFSVIINAEHWFLDALLGFVLAYLFVKWDAWSGFKSLVQRRFGVRDMHSSANQNN